MRRLTAGDIEQRGVLWLRPTPEFPNLIEAQVDRDARWLDVLRRDPCCYCGGPGGTVEHLTKAEDLRRMYLRPNPRFPNQTLGAGHPAFMNNKVGACAECNNNRNDHSPLSWILYRAWRRDVAVRRSLARLARRLAIGQRGRVVGLPDSPPKPRSF